MPQVTFSSLRMEAPGGWADRSTATFLMPPKAADPRLVKVRTDASPGNITVSWVAATPQHPADHLAAQEQALRSLGEGYTVTGRTREEDLATLEATFTQAGQALAQVVVARKVGALQVLVVGTALVPFLEDVRVATLRCARSLNLAT